MESNEDSETDNEEIEVESKGQTIPLKSDTGNKQNLPGAETNGNKIKGSGKRFKMMMPNNNKSAVPDGQPAPTGLLAWIGFGCCVMALASLSVSFCSPYWFQTWPNSENKFRNMGLWHVCFHDYMQFKDDSQQVYDGCWWVFDRSTKYYKLREWLTPPWFISCQVLTTGCLLVEVATAIITGLIFLHFCPVMNHEYLQTYGIFASASMMFLVTMISFVVAIVFGVQCNDRYWLPRPDQNFLSWGFGFLIISAIFALAAGICLFMEAQKTYDILLRKEDEYTKAALEMSTYPMEASYPVAPEAEYGPVPSYGQAVYGDQPNYGPSYGPSSGSYEPAYDPRSFGAGSYAERPDNVASQKFRSFDPRLSDEVEEEGYAKYPSAGYRA